MSLHAGVSRVEITNKKNKANDPLYAKVLVLKSEEETCALVSLDCICLGGGIGEFSDEMFGNLKMSATELGITTFLCGTTHTHTPSAMTEDEETVSLRVLDAIREALSNLKPARVGSAQGHENSFLINRTLKLRDGSSWSIRQAHPAPPDDMVEEIPFADDTVTVLRVDGMDGKPICAVFTFGCHPLLGYANNEITANYPGIAERLVERECGAMAMMFQSCGGDVTECEYKNYDKPKCCEEPGRALGLEVLRVLDKIETSPDASISSQSADIMIPLRQDFDSVRKSVLKEREKLLEALGNCPLDFKAFLPLYMKYLISPEYPLDYAYSYMREASLGITQLRDQDEINKKNIEKYLSNIRTMEKLSKIATTLETLDWHEAHNKSYNASELPAEILGIRIGDLVIVSAPNEPLSQIGERVKTMSDYEKTVVVGYSNGYMHYGAPADVYNDGGYETIECMMGSGWQKIYEDAVREILQKI